MLTQKTLSFIAAWTAIILILDLIYMVFPIVFLCNGNHLMPVVESSIYTVFFSINIVVLLCMAFDMWRTRLNVGKSELLGESDVQSYFGDSSLMNFYRKFMLVFMVSLVDYAISMAGYWGWLDNHSGYLSDPDGQNPWSPSKSQRGFFSYYQFSAGFLILRVMCFIYTFQFWGILFYKFSAQQTVSPGTKTAATVTTATRGEISTVARVIYIVSGTFTCLALLVYTFILYIVSFRINTAMNLIVLLSILSVITGFFVIMVITYYLGKVRANLLSIPKIAEGSEYDYQLTVMFMFLAFFVGINWIFFIDAFVLNGANSVDFTGRLPHLNVVNTVQPLFFYTFVEAMAPMDGGLFILSLYFSITFAYIAAVQTEYIGRLKWSSKWGTRLWKEAAQRFLLIFTNVVAWASFITAIAFIVAAFTGNVYLAVHYDAFIWTFAFVGGAITLGLTLINILRLFDKYNETTASEKAANGMLILSLWRIVVCLPVYYILAMVVFFVSSEQYNLLGSALITQWLSRAKLNGLTVEPVTFYWPEIIVIQFVLLMGMLVIVVDSSASNTTRYLETTIGTAERTKQ